MDLKRSVVRVGLFAAFALVQSASLFAASPNVWVRADGSDAACNGAFNASAASAPNCAVSTLQAAVNVADEGGTVHVGPGHYPGSVSIAKRVSLRGANYQLDPTMDIRGDESVISGASFNVGARGVEIVGFLLDGRGAGNAKAAGLAYALTGAGDVRFENNIVANYARGVASELNGGTLYANRFHSTPEVAFGNGVIAERNIYDWKNALHSTSATTGTRRRPTKPGAGSVLWAMGAPRYVSTTGTDAGDCSTQGSPCRTINYAITMADPTDVINLAAGEYAENVTISKALTVVGPNAGISPNTGTRGAEAVIVPASNNTDSGHVIRIEADNVHLDGFVVDGNNPALTGGVLLNGQDVNAAYGVRNPHGAMTILVENLIVRNLNRTGISFNMVGVGSSSSGNIIQSNRIDNMPSVSPNGRGISILDNFYATISGNVVTRAFIGLQTNNFTLSGAAVSIFGNDIQSARVGIFHNIHNGAAPLFTATNNDVTTDLLGSNAGSNHIGVWFNQITGTAAIAHNNTTVDGAFVGYQAFAVSSPSVTVAGGTVTDSSYGIRMINVEPSFLSAPGASSLTVNGVVMTGTSTAGAYIKDDVVNTNVGTQTLTLTNSRIEQSETGANGILVDGLDIVLVATGNTLSDNVTGVVANGGAISLSSNTIIDNGTGVFFSGAATVPLFRFNRIFANTTTGAVNTTASMVVAELNWWGCNGSPNSGPCNGINAPSTFDANPWLVLTVTAAPNAIEVGATSTVTADLTITNMGVDTSALGNVPDGTPVTFSGTLGTVSPVSATTVAGVATTTFTATTSGTGAGTATVDNATVSAPITITCPVAPLPAVVVTVPRSVPVGSVGNIASVAAIPGATYTWTMTNGTITGGQGTNQITFDAGTPGSIYTASVSIVNPNGCTHALSIRRGLNDFLDVPPSYLFHNFVVTLALNGVTAGCGNGTVYCPEDSVTREQMAVFLLVSKFSTAYQPPTPGAQIFQDVPNNSGFRRWIEDLYNRGITSGCGQPGDPLIYCPGNPVTREQMSVFLLTTQFGGGYQPPTPGAQIFADVANNSGFRRWIEDLYNRGITGGCGTDPLRYCPNNPNTRGQMAVFLSATFGLNPQP